MEIAILLLGAIVQTVTIIVYTDRRITRLEGDLKVSAKVEEYLEKRMDRIERESA